LEFMVESEMNGIIRCIMSGSVLEDSWDEGSFQVLSYRGNIDLWNTQLVLTVSTVMTIPENYLHPTNLLGHDESPTQEAHGHFEKRSETVEYPVGTNSQYSPSTPLTMPCKPSTSTSNEDSQSDKPGEQVGFPVLEKRMAEFFDVSLEQPQLTLQAEKISTMDTASRRRESACRLFVSLVCRRSIIRLYSEQVGFPVLEKRMAEFFDVSLEQPQLTLQADCIGSA
jgi:hypothetical protein